MTVPRQGPGTGSVARSGCRRRPLAQRLGVALALVTTMVAWASGFVGVSVAVQDYSPPSLALFRFLFASAVLFAWLLRQNGRVPLPGGRELRPLLLVGLLGIPLYHIPLNLGQQVVDPGVSSLLVSTAPVFTALVAATVLGERVSPRTWTGIVIAFTGTLVLVTSRHPVTGLSVEPRALVILVAALAFAGYVVAQRPVAQRHGGLRVATWSIWLGTAMLLPFLPGLLADFRHASATATLAAVYLGIVPGALGYVTYAHVLRHVPAARAGSALYAVPPLATLMAWLLLGQRPGAATLAGGAVVLAGVALANAPARRPAPVPPRTVTPSERCPEM